MRTHTHIHTHTHSGNELLGKQLLARLEAWVPVDEPQVETKIPKVELKGNSVPVSHQGPCSVFLHKGYGAAYSCAVCGECANAHSFVNPSGCDGSFSGQCGTCGHRESAHE
jgi:hypothetical protein